MGLKRKKGQSGVKALDIRNISRVNVGARSGVSNANTEGLGTRFMSFLFMSACFSRSA